MRILLDTHILLWFLVADPRLGPASRAMIEADENTVAVSIVSLWEIALKVRIGKLRIDLATVLDDIGRANFTRLDLKETHLLVLGRLPMAAAHRDPFDHLLIAQAQVEELRLVSNDAWVGNYPAGFETRAPT